MEKFPKAAPSNFFLIDSLLRLDAKLNYNLLVNPPVDGKLTTTSKAEKIDRACDEVKRIRKLYSALRYLYRNGSLALYILKVCCFCLEGCGFTLICYKSHSLPDDFSGTNSLDEKVTTLKKLLEPSPSSEVPWIK